jgi:protein phosphatase
VRAAVERAELWDELETDWLLLDCELLPWSVKAEELLRRQYASVGAAATATLRAETDVLARAAARGVDLDGAVARAELRTTMAEGFVAAYRQYCWRVDSPADLRIAPFQILAREGHVDALTNHLWHLEQIGHLVEADPALVHPTATVTVDLSDDASMGAAIAWWEELTGRGGEGMVVKPIEFIARGPRGLVQPAVKCRGREYLRIIYGPHYTAPEHLDRLRSRGLGAKRSLALREFALGVEALERFVKREPLRRVHECVFGVLAMESEPVDPRL